MTPLPKVSPSKYGKPAASPPQDTSAKIRIREKGQLDGPVYQGQQLIIPCKSCPGSQTNPRSGAGTKPNQKLPD